MGLIKEDRVTGNIPNKEAFVVHYPAYPSSIPRALQTLGGPDAILEARNSQSGKLELHVRPEDTYSHPVSGQLRPSNDLLLKITRKKMKTDSAPSADAATHLGNDPGNRSLPQIELCADIIARIPEAYHFEGMADYQHVVAAHADAARRKKRTWTELEEPPFEKASLIDLDHEDLMVLLPPLFSIKDTPENIVLRPPSLSLKKKQEAAEGHLEINIEPALAIDFSVKEIPKEINWKECISKGSVLWRWQMEVSALFEERPIWHKDSLTDRLLAIGLKFSIQSLKRLLLTVAYYFSAGPFQRFWIRKGYDPRIDPDSRMYQRIDFRVAPQLRNYCDANTAKGLKHRWEDLCKFQVFPYKCHTSFQLFDLDDDYIKEEIRKPSNQTACTYGTGWFSQPVHDSFKWRVMMRFLSVYPEDGAKKFLKYAAEEFEKSKRARFHEDVLKSDRQKDLQTNEEVVDDADKNQLNDGDIEVDEAELDDHEEELDAYQALDVDADGEDHEISLQSHSFVDMENNSRSYLQELFDTFPSMEADGAELQDAGNGEEVEYQIYEQDDDDSNLDDSDS